MQRTGRARRIACDGREGLHTLDGLSPALEPPCYDPGLRLAPPQLAFLALTAVWAAIAAPGLLEQRSTNQRLEAALAGKSAGERAALVDSPAVPVSRALAGVVPDRECVTIAAYAGPDAVEYYSARLDYLLYPRRVEVAANSAAGSVDCRYLAVFRDSPANLKASPFNGQWDEQALAARVAGLETVSSDARVRVYRTP